MFRTLRRLLFPNPFDSLLAKLRKKNSKHILLAWNRGLGDVALGFCAMIHRILAQVPDAKISVLVRADLADGFALLDQVKVLVAPSWRRNHPFCVRSTLREMGVDPSLFCCIIENPNPTEWVRWQLQTFTPSLRWDPSFDPLSDRFSLEKGFVYIGVQPTVETAHGSWRQWPLSSWHHLIHRLSAMGFVRVVLLGQDNRELFSYPNVIDLRGKTSLYELLSLIKNRMQAIVVPDSGILSLSYYLNVSFPIHVISLWADPNQGVLKQAVASPNPLLRHTPLIGEGRNLSHVSVDQVVNALFPLKPLLNCPPALAPKYPVSLENVGGIILAGGQGSRLGFAGPKGLYPICGKSLFAWLCEKTPLDFPLFVMTSPLNHEETVQFFERHRNFGRNVLFFQQEMHNCGGVILPKGNGSLFKSFKQSGLLQKYRHLDFFTIVPVENPLADMTDPALIAKMQDDPSDVLLKCVERQTSQEKMGALVEREGRIEVVEYLELDPTMAYRYSYTGMMAIRASFLEKMASIDLPMHWVKKKDPRSGQWVKKGEEFIFDCLPFGKVSALCFEKNSCYAPIKGADSVEIVRQVLSQQVQLMS